MIDKRIRKPSNVLNTSKVLERLKVMEENKRTIKAAKSKIKPAKLQDIADEFSKELGFPVTKQAISYIKKRYYGKDKKQSKSRTRTTKKDSSNS